jgi:phage tail sheath protein FI
MAMKTPGIYIVEKSAFPNSVEEVATAVPAFIGYTSKAVNGGISLSSKPWRIASMAEYEHHFGGAPEPVFTVKTVAPGTAAALPDMAAARGQEQEPAWPVTRTCYFRKRCLRPRDLGQEVRPRFQTPA